MEMELMGFDGLYFFFFSKIKKKQAKPWRFKHALTSEGSTQE